MNTRTTLRSAMIATTIVVAWGSSCTIAADAAKPNIVFILADDLGATDLGCYGSRYYETPHLNRMAAEGLKCNRSYTCGPNCQPTRAALMTGQYAPRTGIYTVGSIDRFNWRSRSLQPVENVTELPLNKFTLGQALKSAGYRTGLFGKWHLGDEGPHHPSQRGFDEAFTTMGRHFDFRTTPRVDVPAGAYLADFLTDRAVQFIREHKDGPFFLCLHHFGVHSPHDAKPELIERFKAKPAAGGHRSPVYAAMIASVDESVGRVRGALDELGLSKSTVVIFTSDNGGVGGYSRAGIKAGGEITDNAPLRGGKGMLYEGGIRSAYVAAWPGKIAPGTVSDEPINSVDLLPTLLELSGGKSPADTPLDGVSYAPLLNGARTLVARKRTPLFWHFPGYLGAGNGWRTTPVGAIRDGDWKLLEFFEDDRRELYNLRDDVGEQHDLAAEQPDKAAELAGKLAAWRKEIGAKLPTPHTPDPDAKLRRPRKRRAE